jgi:hypothetical protein
MLTVSLEAMLSDLLNILDRCLVSVHALFPSVNPHLRENHRLESRMREIRLSGSEGGGVESNRPSLPLSFMTSLWDVIGLPPFWGLPDTTRSAGGVFIAIGLGEYLSM